MNAGIPYDLIYIDDLKDLQKIVNYDALLFPYNAFVLQEDLEFVLRNLRLAVHYYGIGIITGDNFLTDPAGVNPTPLANPYQGMNELLGVTIYGYGAGNITITVNDDTHPVMYGYTLGEQVLEYVNGFFNHYGAIEAANFKTSSTVKPLAQTVTATASHNSILAIETVSGARHVHFATCSVMADGNLMWQALRWAVFGEVNTVGLQISRQDSVFSARNDMDQTRFIYDFDLYIKPLLENYLVPWNQKYNFVGTDFINIGNNPNEGEYTDWATAGPVYEKYMEMGDEIGSHTYTHPYFISQLSEAELTFEFKGSGLVLEQELRLDLPTLGYAQPGNPESLSVVKFLDKLGCYYLSGTYTGKGIGFPSTFGYLSPSANMAFIAPNMFSDYNMLSFKKLTPEETFVIWTQQYNELRNHANTPIIHYHWHDYGPFDYSAPLFEDTFAMAYNGGSEFIVNKEMVERMKMMKGHELRVSKVGEVVTASVSSSGGSFGTLALDAGCKESEVIESVDGWYAYSDKKVILPKNGGTFTIRKGASANALKTRIISLPMRAELLKVSGNDTNIEFSFLGNGTATVKLNEEFADKLKAGGADKIKLVDPTTLEMTFDSPSTVKSGYVIMKQPGDIKIKQLVRVERKPFGERACEGPYEVINGGGKLKFKYQANGGIISAQEPDKAKILTSAWNTPDCDSSVRIIVSEEDKFKDAVEKEDKKLFEGVVSCGDEFWTNRKFGSKIFVHVQQGSKVQITQFETSCLVTIGDVYGSVEITGFVDKEGLKAEASHPDLSPSLLDYDVEVPGDIVVDPYFGTDACKNPYNKVKDGGKLKLKYDPFDGLISYQREVGKAMVLSLADHAPTCDSTARIVVSAEVEYEKAKDNEDKKLFDGVISCGEVFWTTGKIESKTFVHVQQGDKVQTTQFETSCSEPLSIGDVYGSVEIMGFVDKDGKKVEAENHGPIGRQGDFVVYTFVVTNPLKDSPMCDISLFGLKDEVNGQYTADVLRQINNSLSIIGDNGDECLQYGEQWIYSHNYEYKKATTGYVAASSAVKGTDELNVVRQHGDSSLYFIM